jgi:hypothetical protein
MIASPEAWLAIDGGFAVRALLGSQRRKDGSVVRTAAV